MTRTPVQEAAILAVSRWLAARSTPLFRLFGFAGTGKTTLAKDFAAGVGGRVFFAAYTGKAAYVMRQRGCPDATTIHKLIYRPSPKSTTYLQELEEKVKALIAGHPPGESPTPQILQLQALIRDEVENVRRPAFTLNPDSALHGAALLVIDECSMVDERMGLDLLSFGVPILVLGDPAQLPPVRGEGFFTNSEPDVMLTQVHRQAEDSPVIHLATAVRNGEKIGYDNPLVFRREPGVVSHMAKLHEQTIVGRNATRTGFNDNYRKSIMGFEAALPVEGDRLVCLRNNHDVGLLNGGQWAVMHSDLASEDNIVLNIANDEGTILDVVAHTHPFLGNEIPWYNERDAEKFDYGYALTCHKAQGSQWPSVLILDESHCFRDDARRWLYTAITRAAEKVTIVR